MNNALAPFEHCSESAFEPAKAMKNTVLLSFFIGQLALLTGLKQPWKNYIIFYIQYNGVRAHPTRKIQME